MKTVLITGGASGLGLEMAKCFRAKNYNISICGTSEESIGKQHQYELDDKPKNVYNILGDYPDVIEKNHKNGARIAWLTNRKAAMRFMTAGFKKRNFF